MLDETASVGSAARSAHLPPLTLVLGQEALTTGTVRVNRANRLSRLALPLSGYRVIDPWQIAKIHDRRWTNWVPLHLAVCFSADSAHIEHHAEPDDLRRDLEVARRAEPGHAARLGTLRPAQAKFF